MKAGNGFYKNFAFTIVYLYFCTKDLQILKSTYGFAIQFLQNDKLYLRVNQTNISASRNSKMLSKTLINFIEEKYGGKVTSSSDCERLALDIEEKTGERLGFTTLKRLLGFTSEKAEPRQSTLEILALYLGYKSYKELEAAINNKGDSVFDNNAQTIYSNQLEPEAEICISYAPNRRLKLRHREKDEFIVIESINGSLRTDDIIFVDSFTSGLPMIAKEVIRTGENLGQYIAGSKFGIIIEKA